MIELRNLTTGYGQHQVTNHLNASLQGGELVSLLGCNGVGKSTLLKTMSAFLTPLHGEVIIEGKTLQGLSPAQQSRLIGVVLTERPDVGNMTVRSMVGMGRCPYTGFWGKLGKEDEHKVDEAMAMVGITSMASRFVHTLSDGERQKTMIAKALAQETPVILLDEPTAFLDFPSKAEMMRLLRRLAHEMGKMVFLSTHDVEIALQLSDRLWLMDKEGIISGTPEDLSADGSIGRFFNSEGISYDPKSRNFQIKCND